MTCTLSHSVFATNACACLMFETLWSAFLWFCGSLPICFHLWVPDLQDFVTRGGKFFFLYKRAGNRVIVNAGGHMMVSPSALEASVQQSIAGPHPVLSHVLPAVTFIIDSMAKVLWHVLAGLVRSPVLLNPALKQWCLSRGLTVAHGYALGVHLAMLNALHKFVWCGCRSKC